MPDLPFLPIHLLLRASELLFSASWHEQAALSEAAWAEREPRVLPTAFRRGFPLPPTSPSNQQHPAPGCWRSRGGFLGSKTFPMKGPGSASGGEGRRRLRRAKGLFQLLSALPVRGLGSRHIRCLVQMSWLGKKKWPLLLPP